MITQLLTLYNILIDISLAQSNIVHMTIIIIGIKTSMDVGLSEDM